jgi:diguanylate cyclase (GGDEF)-like protein/PAS domain S-box-containing protein
LLFVLLEGLPMFMKNGTPSPEGRGVSSSGGDGLAGARNPYSLLARKLVAELGADHALVGEFVDDRRCSLRTLALVLDGEPAKNLEYDLERTPCEKVVRNGLLCCPSGVRKHFSLEFLAPDLGVESYAGVPVTDLQGRVLGVLAVMGRKPLSPSSQNLNLLSVYAARAGSRLEQRLVMARQKGILRDLEARVETIPVPAYFQDPQGRFSGCNQAFLELFSLRREQVAGRTAYDFLGREQAAALEKDNHFLLEKGESFHVHEESLPMADGRQCEVVFKKSIVQRGGRFLGLAGVVLDVSRYKRTEAEIQQLAYYDDLTGLPNRTLLKDRMEMALAEAERTKRQVAVLFFDLDRFKTVNDGHGHAFGDQLLEAIAGRLKGFVRKSDTLARLGGDEFVIVLSDVEGEKAVTVVADKVLEAIGAPFRIQDQEVRTSTSIGIALYPQDGRNAEALLKNADLAMYGAKEEGRSRYQFFASCARRANSPVRPALAANLATALENQDFSLHYQPMFDLGSGSLTGFEALLRWRRADGRILTPDLFVPRFETDGLMPELGTWVLRSACRQIRLWQDAGHPGLRMAVNVSGSQLGQAGFGQTVLDVLEETGLDPDCLDVEFPHTVLKDPTREVMASLEWLRDAGLRLSVDHFSIRGGQLDFPDRTLFQRIKIDRSHLRAIEENPRHIEIVAAIVTLARSMDLEVGAVGVENRLQLEFLQSCSCPAAQGFHLGRPLPKEDIEAAFLMPGGAVRLIRSKAWPG